MTDEEAEELFWSQGVPFWGNHFPWAHLCLSQNVALDSMLAQSLQAEIPQNAVASSVSVPAVQLYMLNNKSGNEWAFNWRSVALCGHQTTLLLIGTLRSGGFVGENGIAGLAESWGCFKLHLQKFVFHSDCKVKRSLPSLPNLLAGWVSA